MHSTWTLLWWLFVFIWRLSSDNLRLFWIDLVSLYIYYRVQPRLVLTFLLVDIYSNLFIFIYNLYRGWSAGVHRMMLSVLTQDLASNEAIFLLIECLCNDQYSITSNSQTQFQYFLFEMKDNSCLPIISFQYWQAQCGAK